jgi:hypothetical protein
VSRRWFREFGQEFLKGISHVAGSAIAAIAATLLAKIVSIAVGYAVVLGAVEIIEETFSRTRESDLEIVCICSYLHLSGQRSSVLDALN